ncbi:DNA-binding protein, partial [Acidithiobacillus sp. MC6.1]|nr:DNA-binding protein [Acidithiobacillus sp. MC6.1]
TVLPAQEPAPETITRQVEVLAAGIWAEALAIAQGRMQAERGALEAARVAMAQERAEAVELADLLAGELDQFRAEQEALQMLLTEKDELLLEQTREIRSWREEAILMREKAALLEGKVAGLEEALDRIGMQGIPVKDTISG